MKDQLDKMTSFHESDAGLAGGNRCRGSGTTKIKIEMRKKDF